MAKQDKDKNYPRLNDQFAKYSVKAKVLYSQWLIQTDQTPSQVAATIRAGLDANDSLLVTEMRRGGNHGSKLMISDADFQKWEAAARA